MWIFSLHFPQCTPNTQPTKWQHPGVWLQCLHRCNFSDKLKWEIETILPKNVQWFVSWMHNRFSYLTLSSYGTFILPCLRFHLAHKRATMFLMWPLIKTSLTPLLSTLRSDATSWLDSSYQDWLPAAALCALAIMHLTQHLHPECFKPEWGLSHYSEETESRTSGWMLNTGLKTITMFKPGTESEVSDYC